MSKTSGLSHETSALLEEIWPLLDGPEVPSEEEVLSCALRRLESQLKSDQRPGILRDLKLEIEYLEWCELITNH